MKKQVALAFVAALSLSVAGTALAAPTNPFIDVPANHWAYDALAKLQKDGVVSGYGDGTFRGDRNLTRYEMAAMIAKITMPGDDKNGPLIKRLQSEFATELYNLGVRVDKLEKGASTIKFTGDARIRYQMREKDENNPAHKVQSSRFQERVRINMSPKVNDHVSFYGRMLSLTESNMRGTSGATATSATRGVYLDRAEFAWKNGNLGVSVGRMLPKIGQGIMAWNDRVDGIIGTYSNGNFSVLAGLIDSGAGIGTSEAAPTPVRNMSLAQVGYKVNKDIGLTAMYANAHTDEFSELKPWAVGANINFAKKWNIAGEYIENTGDVAQKKGAFARLTYGAAKMNTPGTFEVYTEYLKMGGQSGAAMINPTRFNVSGGLYDGVNGRKGWGFGVTYIVGKNHNLQVFYHMLDSFDDVKKLKNQYAIATNFIF